MEIAHNKEVFKATISKHVATTASDADSVSSDDDRSSSSSEDLNFIRFLREKKDALNAKIAKIIGMAMRKAISYYNNETSNNMKEQTRVEFEELNKEGGFMKGSRSDRATYRNFMTCDVPIFMGDLNPIVSTRWITVVENAFRTSCCEDKNKCITLDDLLGRARIREADLMLKKNNKKKELNREQEHRDVGTKRARFDHDKKGGGSQVKSPCSKFHKLHYGDVDLK
nr:hypothetical protein [Tanacetum cinerariifolium]